ncbi:MAG: hypothetical protein IMZ61_16560 [Planctomycetes bacterium]|nr:hypothetical protein [Planctomycetota bacterium]
MKGIRLFLNASIILACGAQLLAYGLAGFWAWSLVFILAGGGWLLAVRRDLEGLSTVLFLGFLIAAVFGCLIQLSLVLLVFSVVEALTAWDLDYFTRRLELVSDGEAAKKMEKQHIRRVLFLTGLGLTLTDLAMLFRTGFSFWTVFWLVVVIILTAGLVIGYLRRSVR